MFGTIEARRVGDVLRPRDDIVFPLERAALASLLEHERRRRRRDADKRHLLDVGAVGVAGAEAEHPELIDEVADRQLLALRAGATPFVLVGRQDARVRENGLRIDDGSCASGTCCGVAGAFEHAHAIAISRARRMRLSIACDYRSVSDEGSGIRLQKIHFAGGHRLAAARARS